jgi:virulence-associated protein VapD
LKKYHFEWIQGSAYLTQSDDLSDVFKAIIALSKTSWLKNRYVTFVVLKLRIGLNYNEFKLLEHENLEFEC